MFPKLLCERHICVGTFHSQDCKGRPMTQCNGIGVMIRAICGVPNYDLHLTEFQLTGSKVLLTHSDYITDWGYTKTCVL